MADAIMHKLLFIVVLLFATFSSAQTRLIDGSEPQAIATNNHLNLTFVQNSKIWFSHSEDFGKTLSAPVDSLITGQKIPAGMRRGPRIAAITDGAIISAVADGNVYASSLQYGPDRTPHVVKVTDQDSAAREGFSAIASDGQKNVFVVWLDDRGGGKQIWGAASHDGGATFSKNFRIYAAPGRTVCECCHVSVIFDGSQKIIVMFRNLIDGHRDLHLVRSFDGGNTFGPAEKLGTGTWKLDACPMDGGSLVADGNEIFTTWRRASTVFLCKPGQPETTIAPGMQPAIGLLNHEPVIAFLSHRNGDLLLWQNNNIQKIAEHALDPVITGQTLFYESNSAIWCRRLDSRP